MAAFGWMGRVREPIRAAFFQVLGQALSTEDGKRLLADALTGLTRPAESLSSLVPARSLYRDLPHRSDTPDWRPPVFVTARFRTGSTLLWNLFRHVPACRAYYEPLNERRWFDPSCRGDRIDPTHRDVSDYWREYEGLGDLAAWHRDDWTSRRLYLRADDYDAGLEAYLRRLIEAAPARAVLQFNRVDFRLPWLRDRFPDARILHLYRHPRDQWCSTLSRPDEFPPDGRTADFPPHDHYYLLSWARDLSYSFPFLDPRIASHPYVVFYYLWRLSHAFARRYAHASFSYEDLCTDPAREVPRVMSAAGIDDHDDVALRRLVHPGRFGQWQAYADAAWFEDHEAACDAVLGRLGQLPVTTPPDPPPDRATDRFEPVSDFVPRDLEATSPIG